MKEKLRNKFFAIINDLAGDDKFNRMKIYLSILKEYGVETYKIAIAKDNLNDYIKRNNIHAMNIINEDIVNHHVYIAIETCKKGISQMSVNEIKDLIELANYRKWSNYEI